MLTGSIYVSLNFQAAKNPLDWLCWRLDWFRATAGWPYRTRDWVTWTSIQEWLSVGLSTDIPREKLFESSCCHINTIHLKWLSISYIKWIYFCRRYIKPLYRKVIRLWKESSFLSRPPTWEAHANLKDTAKARFEHL